ncbi:MAG: ATP-binding cassette domain-containing protein [Clostridia bacterium]
MQNIEFRVSDGMVMAILGPNGAGKTTLLKCMMGLLTWKQEKSRIDGQNIAKLPMRAVSGQKIAYVPQARGNAL